MACPGSADLEAAIPGFESPEKHEKGRKGEGHRIHDLLASVITLPLRDGEKMVEALDFVAKLRRTRRFKVLAEEPAVAEWLVSKPTTTVDLVLYVQDEIHIIDWKTGAIQVDAYENEQMMFYARTHAHLAPKAKGVWLHIVQPWAKGGNSSWFCDTNRLAKFTADALAAEQKIANGDLTLHPSVNCTFCPANPHSRGDKGTKMCPSLMLMLYPMTVDEDAILNL